MITMNELTNAALAISRLNTATILKANMIEQLLRAAGINMPNTGSTPLRTRYQDARSMIGDVLAGHLDREYQRYLLMQKNKSAADSNTIREIGLLAKSIQQAHDLNVVAGPRIVRLSASKIAAGSIQQAAIRRDVIPGDTGGALDSRGMAQISIQKVK